jgi:hypothetical protein
MPLAQPPTVISQSGRRVMAMLAFWAEWCGVSLVAAGPQRDVIGEPLWGWVFLVAGLLAGFYAWHPTSPLLYEIVCVLLVAAPIGRTIGLVAGSLAYGARTDWGRISYGAATFIVFGVLLRLVMRRMVPRPPDHLRDGRRAGAG